MKFDRKFNKSMKTNGKQTAPAKSEPQTAAKAARKDLSRFARQPLMQFGIPILLRCLFSVWF